MSTSWEGKGTKAGMAHSDRGQTRGCAGKTVRSLDNVMPYLSALEVDCLQ